VICDECGFEYEAVPAGEVAGAIRSLAPRFRALVAGAAAGDAGAVRRRPDPATWSALEYTAHVRDVLLVQRERVVHALVEDRPGFALMHREERVGLAGYADEDVDEALDGLSVAAGLLAHLFDRLDAAQLARRCRYSYPEPAERDLLWIGRHSLHEGEHHLRDVAQVLARGGSLNR
jgi:DNA segregation ATPase FtsK/SpoIIIE, S-DNA-T family